MENAIIEKDAMFWFFDGTIVLLAQNQTGFRVHKSVLALHSEFFAGMFEEPLPVPEGFGKDVTFDGCPVVPLEDTAYDIRQLLLVIYGKNRLKTPQETTFSVLVALIRIGHKYGVHDVVDECTPHLRLMVPATLDEYEKAGSHRCAIQFAPHQALEALHVFRLVDIGADDPRILSFVLFLCAQLDEPDLRDGTPRADGTPEKLSDTDIVRILSLKRELERRGEAALHDVYAFSGPLRDCERYKQNGHMLDCHIVECDDGYDNFVTRIPKRVQDAYRRGDTFGRWLVDAMHDVEKKDWVCVACMGPKRKKQIQLREENWEALPGLAGMPV